jgi:uncharacterized protein with GYD domain
MAKYLIQGSYTVEGVKGLLKDGGSKRRAVVQSLMEKAGGHLESFHFAFGSDDFYLIAEAPDNATAAAVSLAVTASGAATVQTTVLMTPEEVDGAVKQTVDYRPPGA